MSPSSVFVSGLNFEKLRQVMYALKNDIELSQVYYSTVYLVEEFYTLIATEMRSVKKDISYWEVLAESSQWEIYLTQLHNKIYRRMVDRGDASLYAVISRAFPVSLHSIKRLLGPPTLTDMIARQDAQEEDDIDRHLSILHADFNCLACLLALVEESAAHLKLIFNRISDAHVPSFSPSDTSGKVNMTNISSVRLHHPIGVINLDDSIIVDGVERCGSADLCDIVIEKDKKTKVLKEVTIESAVHQNTREALIDCLNHISKSFELFLKHINTNPKLLKIYYDLNNEVEEAENNDPLSAINDTSKAMPVTELSIAYAKAETQISKIIKSQDNCKYYPVGLTDLKARRPSKLERYWAINTVLSAGLCYLGYITTKHLQDGSLQRRCISIRDHVTSLVSEHIVEPISKLGEEFFEKLHRREGIVSREDLVQSRQALTRMLADFSKHGQRSYDVRQMMRGASFSPIGFNEPDTTATATATATATVVPSTSQSNSDTSKHPVVVNGQHPSAGSTSHSHGNNESDVLKASPIDETDAMEALMRTYEKQLQSPIYGMLYGNLMTAMLIQMQKLKVHTEAAMLTMDQILASNELTMAATAAMPAMVVIGGVTLIVRQALRPRASSPGQSTLNLRLAMSDVEKSLQEVYSTSSTTHFQTVEATNGRERTPSLSPFPRSPSFHFPPYQTLKVKKPSPQRDSSLPLESLLLPRDLDKYGEIDDTTESGSEEENQIEKNAVEGRHLVSKGVLSFNLHRLRDALGALFITTYWQGHAVQSKNKQWSMLLLNRDKESRSSGRLRRFLFRNNTIKFDYQKIRTFSSSFFTSYLQFMSSFLSSIFGQIDPSVAIEYKAVIGDLLVLSSPDFEISGLRKIATAVRMRNTYRCLIPPKVY